MIKMEEPCNELTNNRIVLKELCSNLIDQESKLKTLMDKTYEKENRLRSPNIKSDSDSFEGGTQNPLEFQDSFSRSNSRNEILNLCKTTTPDEDPITNKNQVICSNEPVERVNESLPCEPMDVDADIEDYLNYEKKSFLKSRECSAMNTNSNYNITASLSNQLSDTDDVRRYNTEIKVQSPDFEIKSALALSQLPNNEDLTIFSIFPITNKVIEFTNFPTSPRKFVEINIEHGNSENIEEQHIEINETCERISKMSSKTTANIDYHQSKDIHISNMHNSISFEKYCKKLEIICDAPTTSNDLNLNSTFGPSDFQIKDMNFLNVISEKETNTSLPIKANSVDLNKYPELPTNMEVIISNLESSEDFGIKLDPAQTSDNSNVAIEENVESIYNDIMSTSAHTLSKYYRSEEDENAENNLINLLTSERITSSIDIEKYRQTPEKSVTTAVNDNDFDFNSTFHSNDFSSENITPTVLINKLLHTNKSLKSPNTELNPEYAVCYKSTTNVILKGSEMSDKSLHRIPANKPDIVNLHEVTQRSPIILETATKAGSLQNKELTENCEFSPILSSSASENSVPYSMQLLKTLNHGDAADTEFYDNFVEPYDFDYLLNKGNSCVQLDRNSLLLRFDPLLGAPVPVYSNQQSRLENFLPAKEDTWINQKETHGIKEQLFNILTSTKVKERQRMSSDVVSELETNKLLSSNIAIKENANNMDDMENQLKNEVSKTEGLERKFKDAELREEALIKRITEKEKMLTKVNGVVEAYEKAIAELVAEKGDIVQSYEKQLADVKADRDSNYRHLTSLETTFSDLHVKYEKSKEMTQQLQASTDLLMEEKKKVLEDLRLQEQRYLKMKSHAMQQLEIANKQLESLTKEHSIEITKLKALLKKEEISRASINEQLHQKSRENAELMKICDELINGQAS